MEKRKLKMIEKFQCPGCTIGCNTKCGSFVPAEFPNGSFRCSTHSAGTMILGLPGKLLLGMPKGFNRTGNMDNQDIWMWLKDSPPPWDKFNIPVWAIKEDGFVFARTYSPRTNYPRIDVWEDGKIPKEALDVSKFIDDFD